MAQHDYVIANGTGAAVRSDLNGALGAIATNNSGATEPTTTYAYQWWPDTTTGLLKIRNAANSAWVTVGTLASANLGLAALASPTFTGTVTIPTATISTGAGIPLASAASPAIYFTGDTNTGIYSPGADQFAITTGGSGRVFVDSSGRVGIGTTSPGAQLDIASTQTYGLRINHATLPLQSFTVNGTQAFSIGANSGGGGSFYYGTGNFTAATIDSSGRLLVGTVSGSGKVTVSGNSIGTTVALTDAATVAVDLSLANYYTLTLGGSRTLGAPSNQNAGQSGVIVITQDGTGSRTLAYNSVWKFPGGTAPTLTTTANAVDVLVYYVESATRITARVLSDVK